MNVKDLTGIRFGRLVAKEYKGNYTWLCECDCGTQKEVKSYDLTGGCTKSCGCYKKEYLHNAKMTDLTGRKFGRLTVLKESDVNKPGVYWECLCECGNVIIVKSGYLTSGDTKSCGCLQRETTSARNSIHGLSRKGRLYNVWKGMRQRCNNPNSDEYHRYGGRGITITDEWNDYINFYKWAYENGFDESKPTRECTLDRVDNDGNYCPENCRWVSMKEQGRNTCRNVVIEYDGQTKTLPEWAEIVGIPGAIIGQRIRVNGWPVEKALTTPNK